MLLSIQAQKYDLKLKVMTGGLAFLISDLHCRSLVFFTLQFAVFLDGRVDWVHDSLHQDLTTRDASTSFTSNARTRTQPKWHSISKAQLGYQFLRRPYAEQANVEPCFESAQRTHLFNAEAASSVSGLPGSHVDGCQAPESQICIVTAGMQTAPSNMRKDSWRCQLESRCVLFLQTVKVYRVRKLEASIGRS